MADAQSIVSSAPPLRTIALRVTDLTPESFAPYGQVLDVQSDGLLFGPHDAQLDLSHGIPRFYLMRVKDRSLRFGNITHHAHTTQCLGSLNGLPWYLGVTQPTIVKVCSEEALKGDGYDYLPPEVKDVLVFRIDGPRFVKLHKGTWHAGPLFEEPSMDFYNLELSDTNVSLQLHLLLSMLNPCLLQLLCKFQVSLLSCELLSFLFALVVFCFQLVVFWFQFYRGVR